MGDFVPKFERNLDMRTLGPKPLPTAGAIPVKNEKGEITMKKVKVQRYMAGKVPAFAKESDSEEQYSDEEESKDVKSFDAKREVQIQENQGRRIRDPEVVRRTRDEDHHTVSSSSSEEDEQTIEERRKRAMRRRLHHEQHEEAPIEKEELEDEDDEDEIQRRRMLMKIHAKKREQEELLARQQDAEDISDESEETSEEEESESEEEEDVAPRLKPVFVRKRDRITLIEAEKEQERLEKMRIDEEKRKEERKKQSVELMKEVVRREQDQEKIKREDTADLAAVKTDDESEEVAYEQWKIREMKRLRKNRDEREISAREKAEIERIRNMTEEERRNYIRMNPKIITNKAEKGKYKFLQKFYHRGVFFLDEEDEVLKRNFAEATGEDQFDKSVLPKVMQVKNFGKASRSKWTHLTAEDTTDHQGVWAAQTALNAKFVTKHAAGMKSVFDRPAVKKRKTAE
ncbi:microfibril-associated/Pre-mRNA processing domain-containing protein [Ditylenchus destructor]|nr:microfibril-associated/Pre-mRNA processing domain-containing protein [Ditylenchus destructor]